MKYCILFLLFAAITESCFSQDIKSSPARRAVESLASHNPAPEHDGPRNTPLFDHAFDWNEDNRCWKAFNKLVLKAENVWPELVAHLDDDRYCVTYENFQSFNYDFTVGKACREIILRNLAAGYAKQVDTHGDRMAVGAFHYPMFLSDTTVLKKWCEERSDKKLYELQIEICMLTQNDIPESHWLKRSSQETKAEWIAALGKASNRLAETKKAVHWGGFKGEEITRYSRARAISARDRVERNSK